MIAFGTEYTPGHYHARVWARDEEHLIDVMAARGLGERPSAYVPNYTLASEDFERAMTTDAIRNLDVCHALVFLVYLATAAGVCTAADALADQGWAHEAIHWLGLRGDDNLTSEWRLTLERIRDIERKVPGILPDDGGNDATP